MRDPRLTIIELGNILDISIGSAYTILSNRLHMSDNGSCFMTMCRLMNVLEFLASKGIFVVPHPACSPDLQLCDFWHFHMTKKRFEREKHFVHEMVALQAFKAILKRLPQEDFASAFQKWQKWWSKTIACGGGGTILKEIKVWTLNSRISPSLY